MTGPAAMRAFAGRPQPVEIHHRGIWYSGELLGWRHEPDGSVVARVRCRVDGLRHSTWKDLAELRLPDPTHPPRREALAAALGRPAPAHAHAHAAVADDADDRTRPHVLRGVPGARPAKPAHATVPPAAAPPVDARGTSAPSTVPPRYAGTALVPA